MLNAYIEGKDLYAVIGSKSFHVPYEECLEFNNGVLNPDGKARRSKAKTILLGITYGMGSKSLASKLECSEKEAKEIIEYFYEGFPGVKKLTEDSQKMLREKGYVVDMWGRRRHIPDAQLPDFTIKSNSTAEEFNPLIGSANRENSVIASRIAYYRNAVKSARSRDDVKAIISKAKKEHITIVDNRGFINRAMRQCLNARIQGTASSMTKQAMINIDNDEILNKLGFKLTITVHDEVLGICPSDNAEEASKRLSEVMVNAAKTRCVCPFKCDPYVVNDGWYEDENVAALKNKYEKLINSGMSKECAIDNMISKYPFFNPDSVRAVLDGTYEIGRDSLKHGLNFYKLSLND